LGAGCREFDKIAGSNFEHQRISADNPQGVGHAYMDVGSRAMQEQLPKELGIISLHCPIMVYAVEMEVNEGSL
jgi:hypothetical protein